MKPVVENLNEMANEILAKLHELLLEHSEIYEWNRNSPNDSIAVIMPYGNYAYKKLGEEGRQLQSWLLENYHRFYILLQTLMREQPKDVIKTLSQANNVIERTIEQQHTGCKTPEEALKRAIDSLKEELNLLTNLYSVAEGNIILIPDTNALLHNPTLEKWVFNEFPKFEIILTPTLLSELDSLKINHRNEAIRQKSETLINQIKEYRRRGNILQGVNLVNGVSTIKTLAIEPKIEGSLPWLDSTNNDDRMLASVIEVMRMYPRSIVAFVTRDINAQNKAEYAQIPFIEPPTP
jgi:hypothetical protein